MSHALELLTAATILYLLFTHHPWIAGIFFGGAGLAAICACVLSSRISRAKGETD